MAAGVSALAIFAMAYLDRAVSSRGALNAFGEARTDFSTWAPERLAAYKETLDYMYSSPDAIKHFAEIANVPLSVAQKIPGLVPKEALSPDQIVGMDDIMAEAIATKFMAAPLTKAQISELVVMKNPPK